MVVFSTTTTAALGIVSSIITSWMGVKAYQDYKAQKPYKALFEWNVHEVAEFVTYLGKTKRWQKTYPHIVIESDIDGEFLNGCSKYDLIKLGFERKDAKKIMCAFSDMSGSRDVYTMKQKRNAQTPTPVHRHNYAESFYSINTLSS
eukprot:453925_1